MGKLKIKSGDTVRVITGDHKGSEGKVLKVLKDKNKAIVEGVNMAVRHTRQSQTSQGGRIPKAMPIQLSNLPLVDKHGKATRVGFKVEGDKKVRFAKTTGDVIDA